MNNGQYFNYLLEAFDDEHNLCRVVLIGEDNAVRLLVIGDDERWKGGEKENE